MRRCAVLMLMYLSCINAEIIDRIGVTVGDSVITMSEIILQLRVAALINHQPLKLDEPALRQAADRLIEQTLVRREMALGDYSAPDPQMVIPVLAELKRDRFAGSETAYQQTLKQYEVTEEDLNDQLLWQLTMLRFIDLRFRPGVQVPLEDIRSYYRETFVPQWKRDSRTDPPSIGTVRTKIEETLSQQQLDNLLDRWLNSMRTQISIVFRETAFKESAEQLTGASGKTP